jgi:enamine deaminase RidA (YjgF/YER057c/UK114 family)
MPRAKVTIPNVAEAGPGLWSNCIRAGDLLFISGQVARPLEGGRTLAGDNEYEQSTQIFTRIKAMCEGAGGSLDDVVKLTIFVVNIRNNTEVWRARREFFSGEFPASTLVEVRSLATPQTLVEIEAIAYLGR